MLSNFLPLRLHDGSHYAHDDLYVSIDESMVDSYLKVFRAIFEKSQHGAHYKMMMGEAYMDVLNDVGATAVPAMKSVEKQGEPDGL